MLTNPMKIVAQLLACHFSAPRRACVPAVPAPLSLRASAMLLERRRPAWRVVAALPAWRCVLGLRWRGVSAEFRARSPSPVLGTGSSAGDGEPRETAGLPKLDAGRAR